MNERKVRMSGRSIHEQTMTFLMISLVASLSATADAEAGDGGGVKGGRFIDRTVAPWMSQQVQEPCILENPKDPTFCTSHGPGTSTRIRRSIEQALGCVDLGTYAGPSSFSDR
jgi:hypothetical protein